MIRFLLTLILFPPAFLIGLVLVRPFYWTALPAGTNWSSWFAWYPVTDYTGHTRWLRKVWRRKAMNNALMYSTTPHFGVLPKGRD